MKRNIILLLFVFLITQINYSQNNTNNFCAEIDTNDLLENAAYLDTHRNELRKLRTWARKNNKPQVELFSNKLEYWSKVMSRDIKKYAHEHKQKMCERLYINDKDYFFDFIIISWAMLDLNNSFDRRLSRIDITKYK